MTDAHAKAVEVAAEWVRYEYSLYSKDAEHTARGIITAYLAAMADAGWVMVPLEPTREIAEAGAVAATLKNNPPDHAKWAALASYRAMIRAAMLKGAGDGQG